MKILIHTQGGSVETFFQDNPALVARILKGIQPTKVFTGDIITIAGDYSLTTFVASRVNRVDFIAEDLPLGNIPPTSCMWSSCPRTTSENEAM